MKTAFPISPRTRRIAGVLLLFLLLALALRTTQPETLREAMSQREAALVSRAQALARGATLPVDSDEWKMAQAEAQESKTVGPTVIAAESALVFLIAAATAILLAIGPGLSRTRLAQLALIAAILTLAAISTFQAANRFNAAIGWADLAMALIAGWTLASLAALLGDTGRRAIIAAIIGIAAIWIAKGFMQYFSEFPDMKVELARDPAMAQKTTGINDTVGNKLFQGRINSDEIFGFISLSNVFATGLLGMLGMITAVAVAWTRQRLTASRAKPAEPEPETKRPGKTKSAPLEKPPLEVPLDLVCGILITIILLAGLVALPLTGSKGGTALGIMVVLAVAAGIFWQQRILALRRKLLILATAGFFAAIGGMLFYGIRHDALPTASLLFRWHYWTAAVPMIEHAPTWGVGLNNFGDYYLRYKRPSSPEDVQDPHDFFVRLAAEIGLPATALITALLAWLIVRGLRHRAADPPPPPQVAAAAQTTAIGSSLLLGVIAAFAWAGLHMLLAESPDAFSLYMSLIYAVVGGGAFALTLVLTTPPGNASQNNPTLRPIVIATLVAAVGMLSYDIINMALVTGPVAMLFWMMLGLADSYEATAEKPPRKSRAGAIAAASLLAATAVTLIATLWLPLANTSMPWDPAPYEQTYLESLHANDPATARAALQQAVDRAPLNLDLVTRMAALLRQYYPTEPLAPLLRKIFSLDRANARIRVLFALPDSDLPANERIAALEEALRFDAALPAYEFKRLEPPVKQDIETKIRELSTANAQPPDAPQLPR